MKTNPLASVICLCFNQAQYIEEAVQSVLDQDYPNLELIIVDDASTDGSREIIREIAAKGQEKKIPIHLIFNEANKGNCKAFNKGFKIAQGDYFIDLAADDILLPSRVSTGINVFKKLPDEYGVHFCNSEHISEKGAHVNFHFPVNSNGRVKNNVPQGNIYTDIIKQSFICPPTLMFKKKVIDFLEGYDENLVYEDFDFWVRSSKSFKYCFSDVVLVQKRMVAGSLSETQNGRYRSEPLQSPLYSTYLVCEKAFALNSRKIEHQTLAIRIKKEMRQCLYLQNYLVYNYFCDLLRKTGYTGIEGKFYMFTSYLLGLKTLTYFISYLKKLKGLKYLFRPDNISF